jgi:hypothetical protein
VTIYVPPSEVAASRISIGTYSQSTIHTAPAAGSQDGTCPSTIPTEQSGLATITVSASPLTTTIYSPPQGSALDGTCSVTITTGQLIFPNTQSTLTVSANPVTTTLYATSATTSLAGSCPITINSGQGETTVTAGKISIETDRLDFCVR